MAHFEIRVTSKNVHFELFHAEKVEHHFENRSFEFFSL